MGPQFTNHGIDVHRLGDVLEFLRALEIKGQLGRPLHLIENGLGDEDSAFLGHALDAACDVYAVTQQVVPSDHDIRQMDPDPKLQADRGGGVRSAQLALQFIGGAHRRHRALKLHKKAVARPLEYAPLAASHMLVQQRRQAGETLDRLCLCIAHQGGIADDVCG